jgi:hypothetical protein
MWDRAVFIPACREWDALPGCIESLSSIAPEKTLLVLVLNARVNAPQATHEDNQKIFDWLMSFPHTKQKEDIWLFSLPKIDIFLIDRWTETYRLKPKQGVGTARDLGASFICSLFQEKKLRHSWIWSTDADARFSSDYLHIPQEKGTCILPYKHTGLEIDSPAPIALQIYEYSLRYYALGLHFATSPYAYPTIGSTILISIETYQKSHGFPHRMAGEDFYLLAKAAKVAPITYLRREPIYLIARDSDRVPFGTGQGMASIEQAHGHKALYHPKIFEDLAQWIEVLNTAEDHNLHAELSTIAPDFPPLSKLNKLLAQPAKGARIRTRRHEWFDAFRTLKWVHHMRDTKWGTLPYEEAIEMASFTPCTLLSKKHWQEELKSEEEAQIHIAGRSTY